MRVYVPTGKAGGVLPGPRLYWSVYGTVCGWCRHQHTGPTGAVWCQRERRHGEPGEPPDPHCLIVEVLGSGLLRPEGRKGYVLTADGTPFRVRVGSAVAYLPLTSAVPTGKRQFVGWIRGAETCGHRHAHPSGAQRCIEAQARKLLPHRLILDESGIPLIVYAGDKWLWHPTILRPARNLMGEFLNATNYPPAPGDADPEGGTD